MFEIEVLFDLVSYRFWFFAVHDRGSGITGEKQGDYKGMFVRLMNLIASLNARDLCCEVKTL